MSPAALLIANLACLRFRSDVLAVVAMQLLHLLYLCHTSSGIEYYGTAILCDFAALCAIYATSRRLSIMVICLLYILVNFSALGMYVVNAVTSVDLDFRQAYKDCIAIVVALQIAVIWGKSDDGGLRVGKVDSLDIMAAWHRLLSRNNVYKGTK